MACIQDVRLTIDEDSTEDQRKTFVSLAEFACATLQQREFVKATDLLAWNILDGEGVFPRGATEVETRPIVELGRAIIALASGDLPKAPKGYEWFYGTPSGRDVLKVREP